MTDAPEMIGKLASETLAFAEASQRLLELVELLTNEPLAFLNITFDDNGLAASGACELRMRLEASEGLRVLVSALGAVNADLGVIEGQLRHLIQSPVGCDSTTVEAPAGIVVSAVDSGGVSA